MIKYPNTFDYWHGRAKLKTKKCAVEDCGKLRYGIAQYCLHHLKRNQLYGHPLGRAFKPKEYAHCRELIDDLFALNSNHPGLQSALEWIDKTFYAGITGISNSLEWKYVQDYGVPPIEILKVASSVVLFSHLHHDKLPSDQRLTYCIAKQCINSAVGVRKTIGELRTKTMKETGGLMRKHLALFFAEVIKGVEAMDKVRNERIDSFTKPFNIK